jgi:hypothetical protein
MYLTYKTRLKTLKLVNSNLTNIKSIKSDRVYEFTKFDLWN